MVKSIIQSARFQKYFQNVSWLVFEKVFTLFVAMVVGIYVARYLEPVNYGMLSYSISFVGIFAAFVTLGLDQILVRELAKDPSLKEELLGTSLLLKLGGFFFLIAAMMAILPLMKHASVTNTLIMIVAAAEIFKAFEVVKCYFQSRVLSKFVVQVQLLINLFGSSVKILLVIVEAPIVWFAFVVLLNGFLNAVGYIWVYTKNGESPLKWRFNKGLAGSLLKESWPLIFYGFALLTQARIDQVMLGKLLNNYEVGQYSVALRFIEIFGFIPMVLSSTFAPAVTQAKQISLALYHNRLMNFYRLMFSMFLVVAVPIYLFAEDIIVLLYGIEYQPAGILLSLFAVRLFFTNMGVGKSLFILNESLFKYSLVTVAIGAIVNISLNFILIPILASIGSIIASVVSFTITIFVIDLFLPKTRTNQKLIFKGIFSFWKLKEVFKT